jgi:hypothetical protein
VVRRPAVDLFDGRSVSSSTEEPFAVPGWSDVSVEAGALEVDG